jgi:putative FmdB family regulatory protein
MEFDSFQKISDAPLENCPSCHGKLKRVITGGTGVIFKGTGFYVTDYARKKSTENPVKSTEKKPGSKPEKDSSK